MKTAKKMCLFLAAICLSLSACGASNTIPDEKNTQDNPNVTAAESEKGVQAEADSDFEALDSTADTENLYDFTPILSENDIEYTDELHYLMTCKRTAYEQGEKTGEFSEEKWITLKSQRFLENRYPVFIKPLLFLKINIFKDTLDGTVNIKSFSAVRFFKNRCFFMRTVKNQNETQGLGIKSSL